MMAVRDTGNATSLADLHMSGSLKVVFPRSDPRSKLAVLVNTAGGVTGGDRFELSATAHRGAHLAVTTQAAERAYRAQPGQTGNITNTLRIDADARIDWLPQETILFEGASLRRRLCVEMAATARLLMVEPLVLGRAASGERLHDLVFHDRVEIRRDGRPLFLDATALTGDAASHMVRPATGAGAGAMALIVLSAPDAEAALSVFRGALPSGSGVSHVREGLLVSRLLAADSFALRRHLVPLLDRLTGGTLPRHWTM